MILDRQQHESQIEIIEEFKRSAGYAILIDLIEDEYGKYLIDLRKLDCPNSDYIKGILDGLDLIPDLLDMLEEQGKEIVKQNNRKI